MLYKNGLIFGKSKDTGKEVIGPREEHYIVLLNICVYYDRLLLLDLYFV